MQYLAVHGDINWPQELIDKIEIASKGQIIAQTYDDTGQDMTLNIQPNQQPKSAKERRVILDTVQGIATKTRWFRA